MAVFQNPKRRGIAVLLLALAVGGWNWRDRKQALRLESPARTVDSLRATTMAHRERPPRYRTMRQWQRQVESALGDHEAGRSRILNRKQTVDAEIYLLGVELPTTDAVRTLRGKLDGWIAGVAPEDRAAAEEKLAELIHDYDPFGDQGLRVIQIDVPDEPNGRLTGFTCEVDDFADITERFVKGEMTHLENVRGYAASYAGMPLTRFAALMVDADFGEP